VRRGWICGPCETSGETLDFIDKRCPPRQPPGESLVQPIGNLDNLGTEDFSLQNTVAYNLESATKVSNSNPESVENPLDFGRMETDEGGFQFFEQYCNEDANGTKHSTAYSLDNVQDISRPLFQTSASLSEVQPHAALPSPSSLRDVHDLSTP